MQWSGWMLLIGLVLLSTTSPASPSNASPRELKALRAALKKQQRLKEQRSAASSGNSKGGGGAGTAGSSSIGGSGEYVPDAGPWASSSMDGGKEPSCEQLRQMWRQSKRHSRAAEATNEIPQYVDPFARAAALHYGRQRQQQQQLGFSGAEPTLRPRQERRPVVYGRLHSSPSSLDGQEVVDRPPRPFDVLRKLSRTESADGGSSDGQSSGGRSGVVLYGEEDRSPFPKSPAKGSLQHLRELVREEQGGGGGQLPSGVKGSFQQLRDIVREENRGSSHEGSRPSSSGGRSDWSDADVGRVVTSPSDHSSGSVGVGGGSKYSLFAMQGDAPYENPSSLSSSFQQPSSSLASGNNRRPAGNNNYNRLSSFGKSHHRNHNINRQQMSDLLASDPTAAAAASSAAVMASRKPFQLRDPPRPKIGSSRLVGQSQRASSTAAAASNNNNRWSSSVGSDSSDDDVGVVRGYVAGGRTNANPFYSSPPAKPSRRSTSALAEEEEEDEDCGDLEGSDVCRINSDCRCASLALGAQQRCQRGRCVPTSNRNGQQKRQRNHQKRKSSTSLRRRRLEDDEEVEDDEWRTSDRDVESRLEQLLQEEQQQQQQSEDEESWTDESRSGSRPSGRKADAIRDIIDALQQMDQQQESTD